MARDYWFAFGANPTSSSGLAPTFTFFINSSGVTQAPPSVSEPHAGSGLYKVSYTPTSTISFILDGATTGLATSSRYIFGVFDPQDTMGQTLVAQGATLVAIGNTSIALGTTAIAFGVSTIAFGLTLNGIGLSNISLGMTNVAIGTSNIALGMTNVAIGTTNIGFGLSNISLGTTNVAIGTTILSEITGSGSSMGWIATLIGSTNSSYGNAGTDPATLFGYSKRLVEFLEGDQTYTKSSGNLTFYSKDGSVTLINKLVSDSVSETTKT